jgi:putative ABC transport system permease protein
MTAIALVIGVSTMVDSFRKTVDYWLRQTITADLYMTVSSNRIIANNQAPLPEEVVRWVDEHPEVAVADGLRRIRVEYAGRSVDVTGRRLNEPEEQASLALQHGSWAPVLRALDSGDVAVSEGFTLRFRKEVGDTIVMMTPSGARSFRISGVYYDYTSDAGTVLMRHATFARTFGDSTYTNLALYLRNPSQLSAVRDQIDRRFGGRYSLIVYSNRDVRREALDVFDQTFAITYALQLVAVVVAAIGVANTLAALVVERTREIGILKAIGATAAQVRKMTLVQAGLIGVASEILGICAGLLLSAILIYVINRVSFGWTIQFTLAPDVLATSAAMVLVTALLAGLPPANAAARRTVSEVLKRSDT